MRQTSHVYHMCITCISHILQGAVCLDGSPGGYYYRRGVYMLAYCTEILAEQVDFQNVERNQLCVHVYLHLLTNV